MQESIVKTFDVAAVGSGSGQGGGAGAFGGGSGASAPVQTAQGAATLTYAAKTPKRVVVRNIGNTTLLIAHNAATLGQPTPVSMDTFQLPAGQSEVFVLAPRQGLYAASAGGKGRVTISVSDAYLVPTMEA